MLIKMIKVMLSLILALCLGASLSAGHAWAAGGGKQTCDKAIWECVKKAQRMTCNRPWQPAYTQRPFDQRSEYVPHSNHPLCGGEKWWAGPGQTLARGCPSKNQRVSDGAVDAAIKKAHRQMVHGCFNNHVFLDHTKSESEPINMYPGRDQNGSNCNAFADAFAQCLHDKYKRNPFK